MPAQDVNSLMTDFANVPSKLSVDAGKYLCTVVGVDPKKSANAPGTIMFAPQFEIIHEVDIKTGALRETVSAGANLFDSFLPFQIDLSSTMSPHMKRMALGKTKRFLMACAFQADMGAMAAQKPTDDQIVEMLKTQFAPLLLQKQVVITLGLNKDGTNRINDYDVFAGAGAVAGAGAPATAAPPTA